MPLLSRRAVTRSEITARLQKKFSRLRAQEAEEAVKIILHSVAQALEEGERVEVRGFGSFRVGERRAHLGRNPRTGEPVAVASKRVARFKAGKELREKVLETFHKEKETC